MYYVYNSIGGCIYQGFQPPAPGLYADPNLSIFYRPEVF